VITEGDQGDCLYVVKSGRYLCTKLDQVTQAPRTIKEYTQGESFGELALLYNTPRAASITALTNGVLWRLDRETFTAIVRDGAAKTRERFDKILSSIPV
jgi:cAMP-dependent protein kinase regulator